MNSGPEEMVMLTSESTPRDGAVRQMLIESARAVRTLQRVAILWCGLFVILCAMTRAQSSRVAVHSVTAADQAALSIGPGDLLDLSVYHVPELLLKVRVDSNGYVSLPLIGDMRISGLTVRDAQLRIAHKLVDLDLVRKPQVSLFVEEFATEGITVYGEVTSPGIYPLLGPHTLYDAISAAGGLTVKAGHTVTVMHAGQPNSEEVISLPDDGTPGKADVMLSPGDTVVVSKTGVVYVMGEVNKPGAFLMENNTTMSLLKALALAGSATKVASLKHVYIIRKGDDGMTEIEVRLDKLNRSVPDVQLRAEDIVFVPLSNIKNYGAMGLQGALQAAVYSLYAFQMHN
jgi:polysaccharide export outer membrane protein